MIAKTETTTDIALRWVADNYGRLQRMCRSMAGGNDDIAIVLMDEVVDQTPRLFETWDSARGELAPYLNWRLRRRLAQRLKRYTLSNRCEQLQDSIEAEGILPGHHDRDAVFAALDVVTGIEFYVVAARLWYAETFDEIAADLHTNRQHVQRLYAAAVERMKASFRSDAESLVTH